jgi:citrate lyase subunit beta / citryl-CoA lyase
MAPSDLLTGPAILFCPADRPDRFQRALDRADMVVIDLEDAVAPADKPAARQALIDQPLDPQRTFVRVNDVSTAWFADDLSALAATNYNKVMLPKAEGSADVERLLPFSVVAICESPRGVLHAGEIAGARNTIGLVAGVEDLIAALGGMSTRWPDKKYRDVPRYARSCVMIAARAFGKLPIDTVYLDINDLDGQRRQASDAVACGFAASCCIHPSQVPVIRQAYRPTQDEAEWAQAVLAEAQGNSGVFSFRGRMIDSPILRQAELILARCAAPA